ncbi:zinc ribbon domain-containing protein [Intestinibaculum porci]|uniref:zinc ribbon domain-containing protein n=1 Tax=Intestinibaculum porci TaxID=2487118 RepID=UPI00240A9033|nr:zinc ribbon domain-containing protein [Intestinibaculum porci]MDD6350200.1 discoidin domain-containing protein [Intestinibaculum porci]
MRCPYCGEDNPDSAFVCEHCGQPLKRSKREYVEKLQREEEENSDDFFEKNIYHEDINEEPEKEEHTEFYKRETTPETAFHLEEDEPQENSQGFAFDEEEPYEEIEEPRERGFKVYWARLKDYLFPPKDEQEEDIQEKRRGVKHKFINFMKDRDEEDDERDEEATKIYHPGDPIEVKPRRSIRVIPFKVLGLVLVVALIFGGILMSKKKSTSTTTTETSTKTTTNKTKATISSTPTIASVAASSTLQSSRFNYSPSVLTDGDPTTAWNEGADGDGIGETVTFTLKQKSKVTSTSIYNGYDKSYSIYYRNNRVKSCYFIFDDGKEFRTLNDYYNRQQKLTFYKVHKTKKITIKIVSVYRGSSYHDTCLSEVSFA